MKKIISLLIVVALLSAGLVISAFADEAAVITVEKTEAKCGEEVTMEVVITGNPGFAAAKFVVSYDAEALTLVGVDTEDMLCDGATENDTVGVVAFAATSDVTGDGKLFTITFKVNEGVEDGNYAVSVTVGKFVNADREAIEYTIDAGSVAVVHACDLQDVEEVPASCTENGVKAHQKCSICGELYLDGEVVTEADLVLVAGHTEGEVVIENKVDATCTEEGSHDEVVYCTECKEELSRKTVTDSVIEHVAGEVVIEDVVESTCTEEGSHDEVVYCTECEKELSRKTVTDPKAAHSYVDGKCEHCGAEEQSPATGDYVYVAVATALVSMMGIVALTKKKEF